MSQYDQSPPPLSGWAVGGMAFAATLMVIIGAFQALSGLVAIFDDGFYVVTQNYTFDVDVTAWGWIHLLLGIVILLAGLGLYAGKVWAGTVALVLAILSIIANFLFIPYYPWWSIIEIALAVWVIWAITRPGAIRT